MPEALKGEPEVSLVELQRLIERLRAPDGCPWDREQTLGDLRAYLIEEAHEVAAAIDSGDRAALAEELGDLLFQVVFIGRLGAEEGSFTLRQVTEGIHRKMIERHPHIFGDAEKPADGDAVAVAWEKRKLAALSGSLLDGVPASLPALTGAYRLTQKAARIGFDWQGPEQVLDKVREELREVEEALARRSDGRGGSTDAVDEELGDLLFAVANLARHLGRDPESSLARGNLKFRRRFAELEADFGARGLSPADAGLEQLDEVWRQIKQREKARPRSISPAAPRAAPEE